MCIARCKRRHARRCPFLKRSSAMACGRTLTLSSDASPRRSISTRRGALSFFMIPSGHWPTAPDFVLPSITCWRCSCRLSWRDGIGWVGGCRNGWWGRGYVKIIPGFVYHLPIPVVFTLYCIKLYSIFSCWMMEGGWWWSYATAGPGVFSLSRRGGRGCTRCEFSFTEGWLYVFLVYFSCVRCYYSFLRRIMFPYLDVFCVLLGRGG